MEDRLLSGGSARRYPLVDDPRGDELSGQLRHRAHAGHTGARIRSSHEYAFSDRRQLGMALRQRRVGTVTRPESALDRRDVRPAAESLVAYSDTSIATGKCA